jgi:hypothetical protein
MSNIRKTRATLASLFLIGCTFVAACNKLNPAAAKGHLNRGSCLQILEIAVNKVREYAQQHTNLPPAAELWSSLNPEGDRVLAEALERLEYAGESATLQSAPRTIILRCRNLEPLKENKVGRYVALMSGEVLVVPEAEAQLGTLAPSQPSGKGKGIDP